ncbi:MAG: hypothetical protein QOH87_3891 [Trebonia sp.]|nr:hypothetical protein [Trebonia sp.]
MSECPAGCCPHDSASVAAGCPRDLPGAPLPERAAHLRGCQLLSVRKIAAVTGADRLRVTQLLYEVAIEDRPRGAWRRMTRRTAEDERVDQVTALLSREQQMPATQVAPPPSRGPSEIELLAALYAAPEVRQVLDRHGVPVATLAGPAWRRFPAPRPLTAGLVGDLYEGCGLSLHQIALLTGRPAAAAGAVLRASGVKLRPPGGRSPFLDRWRPGKE